MRKTMFEVPIRAPLVRTVAALTIAATNLLSQSVFSQTENAITLPPMVVTATRTERSLADQPDSVTVITRQQIQETPAQSLDDVLRTIPSVDLPLTASYQVHPTANSVSMRGLGGIRALVLLDGVPVNDPFFGYIQWNRVPMENVERVEVVRGGGSPLWGNYAMGGVINIITRVPDQKEVGLEAGGGNYGTYRSNSYGDLVLSDSLKARINVNGWGTAGFSPGAAGRGPDLCADLLRRRQHTIKHLLYSRPEFARISKSKLSLQ
jgi:outer membrane cobalamin receptor